MTNTFKTISPVDGSVYQERNYANGAQIEAALSRSETAFKAWKSTTVDERADICRKVVEYFLMHVDDIASEISWQMGRPITYTPFEISKGFQERALYMIEHARQGLEDIVIEEDNGFKRFMQKEPLGTVLVLAPWNYPYLTSVNAIIPAIMAGNTVMLKHAEQTPLAAERYARAFEFAGLPGGVYEYLHLSHDQVRDVIGDERIAHVAFTGSVEGGMAIQNAVNQRFISAGLELGGKDPAYVRGDANLNDAVENLVDGAFFNSGQSCCGIERIYVHQSIFDSFVESFVSVTKGYVLGNPLESATTLGPMVRTASAQKVIQQIDQAKALGARTLIDGSLFSDLPLPYLAPQVLIDVDHRMDLMTVESFGPVVGIMPVKNDQEAVQFMNDSSYGLTASVWTSDQDAAMDIGQQVETGTWFMNRCDYLDPALAWTGIKNSGKGCTLSTLGYDQLTRPKSFHLKVND